jgi:hypothetical protein
MTARTVRNFNAVTAAFCAIGAVADSCLGCWRIATFSLFFAVINVVCAWSASRAPARAGVITYEYPPR